MATSNVIDFAAAKRAAAAQASCPFESPLLKAYADKLSPEMLQIMRTAVAEGFTQGRTTGSIVASIRRDAVRLAARAAL
ncbi:hypothetical protein [Variovorax sp. dw_308]|uniref:hypothetical protein n=1 Tax=Variovorax sp. dw_308 TaxID=2721546 RepID=UPI001C48C48B|nr:hypothetical protein [Variovorax sp. dw_308]